MSTIQKIIIISLVSMAAFQIVNKASAEKRLGIKPVVQDKWMNRGYMHKNFKYCKGKFYKKNIDCKWVTK